MNSNSHHHPKLRDDLTSASAELSYAAMGLSLVEADFAEGAADLGEFTRGMAPVIAAAPGDTLEADFGALGTVAVSFR